VRALRSYGLVLLVFGIPFGLLTGLCTGWWLDSASAGAVAGLGAGGVVGGLCALVLGTLDLVGDREARPGERHGPRQSATVAVRPGPDLPHRIRVALLDLPAEIRGADDAAGRYTARARWSWRSFGEDVTIQLIGDPAAPVAEVSSTPVVRTTLIDYGRGHRNGHRVAEALRD
jgi:hypothetical protein